MKQKRTAQQRRHEEGWEQPGKGCPSTGRSVSERLIGTYQMSQGRNGHVCVGGVSGSLLRADFCGDAICKPPVQKPLMVPHCLRNKVQVLDQNYFNMAMSQTTTPLHGSSIKPCNFTFLFYSFCSRFMSGMCFFGYWNCSDQSIRGQFKCSLLLNTSLISPPAPSIFPHPFLNPCHGSANIPLTLHLMPVVCFNFHMIF